MSSNIATLEVNGTTRLFYLDSDSYVVEWIGGTATRIGPQALPASNVAAAYPWGRSDGDWLYFYIFFISPDRSLSQMTYDGQKWSQGSRSSLFLVSPLPNTRRYLHVSLYAVNTAAQNFAPASRSDIDFTALSWTDPPLVHIYCIGQDRYPSLLAYQNGSWRSNPDPKLPLVSAVAPGEPISAIRGGRNSEATFVEVFFASGLAIANVAKFNSEDWFVGDFGVYDIASPPPKVDNGLSMSDKIALGCGIGIGIPAIIVSIIAAWWFQKA